jgi:membrane-bound lytic murein transglycosylase A
VTGFFSERVASRGSWLAGALGVAVLAACAGPQTDPVFAPANNAPVPVPVAVPAPVVQPTPSPAADAQTAAELSLTLLGAPDMLPGWQQDTGNGIASTLGKSCGSLLKRADGSGLTLADDWKPLCAALAAGEAAPAALARLTRAVAVGDGLGLNTGYFEPLLEGSTIATERYATPLYKRPADLIDVSIGEFRASAKGQRTAGRVQGSKLVPYHDRAQIEEGALAGKSLELLWMADPYETFSLHIQGSGQVKLPDGSIVRVGYDGQNGHEYVGVGKLLRQRGVLAPGQATMDGILNWARANPADGKALFRENRSFVFFRKIDGDGPIGSLSVALTPERSIAVDPLFVPLGAPVWLNTRHVDPQAPQGTATTPTVPFVQVMIAQDTGGAIKGANRLDIFFGSDMRARALASAQSQRGSLTLLLPLPSVERLKAAGKIR